jgi:hypothetical protein
MTYRIQLEVNDEGYSWQSPAAEVRHVALDGGPSRTRSDLDGATFQANVAWLCSFDDSQYLYAVYRTTTVRGTEAVLVNLALDAPPGGALIKAYVAHFIPGSFRIEEKDGTNYLITAVLEVTPSADDPDGDAAVVAAFVPDGWPIYRLYLVPVDDGYSATPNENEVIRTMLDGPAGRYSLGKVGGVVTLPLTFGPLNAAEYSYFMSYWRSQANRGATPARIKLFFDGYAGNYYRSKFVPGTLTLQKKDGNLYWLGVTVEVAPPVDNAVADQAIIDAY